jgi:hypothetical protein
LNDPKLVVIIASMYLKERRLEVDPTGPLSETCLDILSARSSGIGF